MIRVATGMSVAMTIAWPPASGGAVVGARPGAARRRGLR
ncbi:hypothetical protein BURPS305_5597 [Burkholderia pseudomallei 305]|nr:hypothetical protein BURPS305_5597 [Burkholderia pseudomallei 305]EDU10590.1 hypothetical protein BURPS1655_I0133 [Burkholderia pseudomallei 1655]